MSQLLQRMSAPTRERLARDVDLYGDRLEELSRSDLAALIREREPDGKAIGYRARLMCSWLEEGADLALLGPRARGGSHAEEKISIIPDADGHHMEVNARGQSLVRNVEELLEAAEIDLDKWTPVGEPTINTWTTSMMQRRTEVDEAGEVHEVTEPAIVRNWQVKARLGLRLDAASYAPPKVQIIRAPELPPLRNDGREVAVFIPDAQIGYRRNDRGRHIPVHDLRVLDAAMQLIARLQPEHVVWLGDNLDAAEVSSFDSPAQMIDTARPAVAEFRFWLGQCVAAAPRAKLWVLEGNHEERVQRQMIKHLAGFAHATRPGESHPAFSMRTLIQPEDFGATYVGPYREAIFWLWDRVRVSHGDKVRPQSGGTVAAVAKASRHSEIFGHIHRAEVCHETYHGPGGRIRQRFIASPGCACRLAAGLVPGHKAEQNWQQALGVVSFDLEHQEESIVMPTVRRGVMHFGGQRFEGRDCIAEVEESTGWPMVREWLQPGE